MKRKLISILLFVSMLGLLQISAAGINQKIIFAPETPIKVNISLSNLPALNGIADATITVKSDLDAPNTNVELSLPDGVVPVGGKTTWNVNLKANESTTLSTKIKITKNGNLEIRATAKSVIDQNSTWGDTSAVYLGVSGNTVKAPFDVPRVAVAEGNNIPANVKIISKDIKIYDNIPDVPAPVRDPKTNTTKVAPNNPGTVTVAGTFSYWTKPGDFRDTSTTLVPARYYLVYIFDGNNNPIDYTYTDNTGYFEKSVTNPGSAGLKIRFYAYYNSGYIIMVVPPGKGEWYDSYYIETLTFELPDGYQDTGDWQLPQHNELEGAFWIKDDIERAWEKTPNNPGGSIVEWSYTSTDGPYYTRGGHIHLRGEDRISPDTVIHEYGHNVMYNIYGNWLPSTDCPSPHYLNGVSGTVCAWTEGWADFYPLYVNGNPIYTWPSGAELNLETPTWGTVYWDNGEQVEGRVAGALWDIYDENDEEPYDKIHDGIGNIWSTIYHQKDDGNANDNSFWLYWNVLKTKYASDFNARSSIYQNTIDYNHAPDIPDTPSPADGAINQPTGLTLTWDGGDPDGDSIDYNVLLDTNTFPTTSRCTGIGPSYCAVSGLKAGTKYYWRITATDYIESITGPTWSFTTTQAAPESVYVFSRGSDSGLWYREYDGTSWSGWQSLGGSLSALDVTRSGSNVYAFVRGMDGELWDIKWNGASWDNWESLGGSITDVDSTSADANVYSFARSADSGLWYRKYDGTSWSGWQSLGGSITNLTSTAKEANNLNVFARGGDGGLWYRNWDGTSWNSWQSLGGAITDLDATSSGNNVYVFVRGGDGGLWYRNWSSTSWSDWQSLGGPITRLDSVSSGNNVYVFVRGEDGGLWYRNWDGTSWNSWQGLGGAITDLDAVSSGSNVYVFVRGAEGGLWYRDWDGTSWSDWQSLGGSITDLDATSLT